MSETKPLSKMNKAELIDAAQELSIEIAEDATKAKLIDAIKAADEVLEEAAEEDSVEEAADIPCPDDPGAVAAHAAYADAFTAAAVAQAEIESRVAAEKQRCEAKEQKLAEKAVAAGIAAMEEARIEREKQEAEEAAKQ